MGEHISEGKIAMAKILRQTESFRNENLTYEVFSAELESIGTPYRYSTFYMNNSTYKSLLSNGRLQLFPESVNKKLRDYYEYVSKRVEDNNDIVDAVSLRYYSEHHPWVNYLHGVAALKDIDINEIVAGDPWTYFDGPGVREHYSDLSFLHATLAMLDRVLIHGMQVGLYKSLRNDLEEIIATYAAGKT
ncbi:MAG: hypothetical protein MK209_06765 [Planctomycetes bacterium]|nr:hypothetical protein [Planctomycetota bacterium]